MCGHSMEHVIQFGDRHSGVECGCWERLVLVVTGVLGGIDWLFDGVHGLHAECDIHELAKSKVKV